MKLLAPNEMVSLLPAEIAEATADLLRFESLTPTIARAPGDVVAAVQSGSIKAVTVSVNAVPAYLLGFHLSRDGGLWIDIAQTLDSTATFAALNEAIHHLARTHQARYTRLTTARRGLVRVCQAFGFTPEAVLLTR